MRAWFTTGGTRVSGWLVEQDELEAETVQPFPEPTREQKHTGVCHMVALAGKLLLTLCESASGNDYPYMHFSVSKAKWTRPCTTAPTATGSLVRYRNFAPFVRFRVDTLSPVVSPGAKCCTQCRPRHSQ